MPGQTNAEKAASKKRKAAESLPEAEKENREEGRPKRTNAGKNGSRVKLAADIDSMSNPRQLKTRADPGHDQLNSLEENVMAPPKKKQKQKAKSTPTVLQAPAKKDLPLVAVPEPSLAPIPKVHFMDLKKKSFESKGVSLAQENKSVQVKKKAKTVPEIQGGVPEKRTGQPLTLRLPALTSSKPKSPHLMHPGHENTEEEPPIPGPEQRTGSARSPDEDSVGNKSDGDSDDEEEENGFGEEEEEEEEDMYMDHDENEFDSEAELGPASQRQASWDFQQDAEPDKMFITPEDELSPDELDRVAQQALWNEREAGALGGDENGGTGGGEDEGPALDASRGEESASETEDVMQRHYKKNRPNKAPQLNRLAFEEDDPQDEQLSEEEQSQQDEHQRAERGTGGKSKKKELTIKFYPSTWQAVLVKAKRHFRLHLTLENFFPTQENNLTDIAHIIAEQIVLAEEEGVILDQAYQNGRDMQKLIFAETSTFRGRLKTKAFAIIENDPTYRGFYPIGSSVEEEMEANDSEDLMERGGFGPEEGFAQVKRRATRFKKSEKWHTNSLDEEGRTNNYAHPLIPKLIHALFYSSTDNKALAKHFPEDFNKSVPQQCLIIVLTLMYHYLKQWCLHSYTYQVPFSADECSKEFSDLEKRAEEILLDEYHGNKLRQNLKLWAQAGMRKLKAPETAKKAQSNEMKIVLD